MNLKTPTGDLLTALGQLGFGQYEARAYCALLSAAPMNGHEVAKASGVPPSKIYETLARLAEKGAVLVQHADPVIYAASPRETVLAAARAKFQRALETAETGLKQIPVKGDPGQIWSLKERDAVLAAATSLIAHAKRSLFATLWDEELGVLRDPLEQASRRGCKVHVAVYGTTVLDGPHGYDLTLCGKSAMERLAGRRLTTLVADQADALIAEFHPDGTVEAVRTSNPVVGLLAVEYVKADILGRLLIDDMGDARFDSLRYNPGLIDVLLRS